jgi:RNA polymerase sigma factor (sigma-70 family)
MATPASSISAADELVRLHDEYRGQLYRFCLARLRSREEAEDAVQNTFLRAYSALARGVVPQSEAAWLYTIAQRVCISRGEASRRRARVEALRDPGELAMEAQMPEHTHELEGLAEALAGMPANLRQAILLREWRGLSYREIAAEMELSQAAVETLIFRARRHLAAALGRVVERPARSLAGLLDVAWLLGALRSLLRRGRATAAVSTKAAVAGSALLVAAAGLGVGVTLSSHSRPISRSAAGTGSTQPGQPSPGSIRRASRGNPLSASLALQASRPVQGEGTVGSAPQGARTTPSLPGTSRPASTALGRTQTPPAGAQAAQAAQAVHEVQATVAAVLSAVTGVVPNAPTVPAVPAVPTVATTPTPPDLSSGTAGTGLPTGTTPTVPSLPPPVTTPSLP